MPDDTIPAALAALGKFEVLGKLGQGGMGAVYKARRKLLQDIVAVKVMGPEVSANPELRARFLREMRATARLTHPHIVRAMDAEEVGDLLYLVMEYVEGISLQKLVQQKGPVPVAYACKWILQAAEGLQHAHELGMVHRDVKPANLMLTAKDKAVKVLDFGLVQVPKGQGASLAKTKFQTFMGTPEYVAPEQATDARRADIRSDIYSLGCTLYFLLTGRPTFEADTVINMILAHLQEEPVPLAKLRNDAPVGLSSVVARMLAKNPGDRFQTPAEVAETLRPFAGSSRKAQTPTKLETETTATRPPPLPEGFTTALDVGGPILERERQPRSKSTWVLLGLLLGVVAMLGAGVGTFFLLRGKPGISTRSQENLHRANGGELMGLAREFENAIGMKLVKIPAGRFFMGSPEGTPDRSEDEGPRHEVEISAFYLGVYKVTQEEYEKVMGKNPSYFSATGKGKAMVVGMDTSRFPVEQVSWQEAMEFCEKLNKEDRKKPSGWEYRLPREAEWEYACRGGAQVYQAFAFGDSLSSTQANFNGHHPFGDAEKGPYLDRTTTVGSYKANAFGLFDMHGNVWEWCKDYYDAEYYQSSPRRDPPGPEEGKTRVYRGGSWDFHGRHCRSAERGRSGLPDRVPDMGFRVALVPRERK